MVESHNQNPIRKISRYSHGLSPLNSWPLSFICKKNYLNSHLVTHLHLILPKGVMYMCMKGNMHIFVELSPLFTHKFVDVLQVLGYPSKPIGLFRRKCIIFRSDSNGEDLKGYIGAGLYYRWNLITFQHWYSRLQWPYETRE